MVQVFGFLRKERFPVSSSLSKSEWVRTLGVENVQDV